MVFNAILFYQFGKPLSVTKILAQFKKMLHSFPAQIKKLKGVFTSFIPFSLINLF